jgi:hypothetical protein
LEQTVQTITRSVGHLARILKGGESKRRKLKRQTRERAIAFWVSTEIASYRLQRGLHSLETADVITPIRRHRWLSVIAVATAAFLASCATSEETATPAQHKMYGTNSRDIDFYLNQSASARDQSVHLFISF